MKREIKFRAWVKDYDEPYMLYLDRVEGRYDFEHGSVLSFVVDRYREFGAHGMIEKSRPNWTIMQYTGLKDNNGVEIYEGDIVKLKGIGTGEIIRTVDDITRVSRVLFDGVYSNCQQVIGNIHQNPELLTQ